MYLYNYEFETEMTCGCECTLGSDCDYECVCFCECISEDEIEISELADKLEIFSVVAIYLTLVFSSFYFFDFMRSNLYNIIVTFIFVFAFFPTFSRIVVIFDLNILEAIIRACIRIYQGFKIGLKEKTNENEEEDEK